jgi:hypothetical protein
MSDTQMLSKYLPKKLYNAAADEDGTALTAKEALPEDRLDTIEALLGKKAAQTGSTISEDVDDLVTLVGDYTPEDTDLATDLTAALGDIDALQAVAPEYTATFATAAAAQGTLTLTGNVTADDEVTIGSVTYKFVAKLAAAYDVAIADTASDTIDNLIAAITAGEGVGTAYGTGTVAHPDVTAAVGQDDTMTVTAKIKGVAGNAIGTTDPTDARDVIAFGAAALAGGVDGQVGATGKIIFTDDVVYFCTDGAKCTIADSSGWKSAALL